MSETGYETNPSGLQLAFAEDGASLETATEKVTATFAFVRDAQGRLLTLRNERGWDIPGGHLDEGESVLDATHREVLEESSVTIKNLRFHALIINGDTAMSVFTAEPDEIRQFVQYEEDPTSDRTFMDMEQFMQVYSGGDKGLMSGLIERLPNPSE